MLNRQKWGGGGGRGDRRKISFSKILDMQIFLTLLIYEFFPCMITWLNARPPTTLNITLNNTVIINIVVQNVGGFRGECRMGSGPKTAILRQIVTRQTDFLILTETKTKKSQIQSKTKTAFK